MIRNGGVRINRRLYKVIRRKAWASRTCQKADRQLCTGTYLLALRQLPQCTTTSVALLPLSHRRARTKLQWQTLQNLLDVLQGLVILDLCSEGTWTVRNHCHIQAIIHIKLLNAICTSMCRSTICTESTICRKHTLRCKVLCACSCICKCTIYSRCITEYRHYSNRTVGN